MRPDRAPSMTLRGRLAMPMGSRVALLSALLGGGVAGWAQPAASPPTSAGNTGLSVRSGIEVFAQYAVRSTSAPDGTPEWSHAFDVPRAHVALTGEYGDARARVVLEAVSPALGGSIGGVASDAFVFRLREAFGAWAPGRVVRVQAGVVPTLTIPEVEGTWRLRAVAPTRLEQTGLGSPADLGATVRVDLPRTFGWVGIGAFNGEGYTGRELNRGKSVELAASVHPIPGRAFAPLAAFASYVVGSTGVGSTRSDRLTAGALWQAAEVRAGAVATIAWGVNGDSGRVSYLVEAFARVEPVERLLVGLRYSFLQRDDRIDANEVHTVLGTVGYRVIEPLEVFAAASRSIPGAGAAAALPGSDQWEFRMVSRGVY